jgi:hypothetical protein
MRARQSGPVQLAPVELIEAAPGLHLSLIADQGTAQGNRKGDAQGIDRGDAPAPCAIVRQYQLCRWPRRKAVARVVGPEAGRFIPSAANVNESRERDRKTS